MEKTSAKIQKPVGETYKEIGTRIAFYRRRRKMTQEELAAMCGISKSFLGKIEAPNITASFSIAILEKIADALGIPIKELFNPVNEELIL